MKIVQFNKKNPNIQHTKPSDWKWQTSIEITVKKILKSFCKRKNQKKILFLKTSNFNKIILFDENIASEHIFNGGIRERESGRYQSAMA